MVKKISVILLLLLALINIFYFFKPNIQASPNTVSNEDFNPELFRINTQKKIILYVDSIYGKNSIIKSDSVLYCNLMARTIRQRFYHGLSNYSWNQNWVLWCLQKIHPHCLSIVIPRDVLKYSEALCSQQAIVGMEALKQKGYDCRKVGFFDSKTGTGHFAYEVLINNKWHFYDVNLEPNILITEKLGVPSIDSIANDEKLIDTLYKGKSDLIRKGVIKNYFRDKEINEFPAKKMRLLHYTTLFISITLWFWLWLLFRLFTNNKR